MPLCRPTLCAGTGLARRLRQPQELPRRSHCGGFSYFEGRPAVTHEPLERVLTTLGTLSTISPLMGLFGTVVGMLEIFGSQSPTGTNPQELAPRHFVALYKHRDSAGDRDPGNDFFRHLRGTVAEFRGALCSHTPPGAAGARAFCRSCVHGTGVPSIPRPPHVTHFFFWYEAGMPGARTAPCPRL